MTQIEMHSHKITLSGVEVAAGDPLALFPYWSFTKTVIAICALKLVEAGQLHLDRLIEGQPYTLRQLLNHTAGLRDYGQFPEYGRAVAANEKPWSQETVLKLVMDKGFLFHPGAGWSYSNIGYMLICELIEKTAGKPLDVVISDMVSTPLGLTSVELAQSREQFSKLHWKAAAGYDPKWVYHGCLIGTARDAASLLHGLFQGQLLKPETRVQMLDAIFVGGAIEGRPWETCGYALGLMSGEVADKGRAIGHSGVGPFSVNAVCHFPDVDDPVTVACFTSGVDEGVAESQAVFLAKT